MRIVGLGYKARQGKNTVARGIIQHCATQEIYAKEYGFATALKAYCRVLGMRKKDGQLLQTVGTDVFRHLNPDIWVRVLMDTIEEDQPDVAIITDMRFPNEVEAIKAQNGLVVRVSRINPNGTTWIADDRPADHSSEIALDGFQGFDYYITAGSAHQAIEAGRGFGRKLIAK